MVCVLKIWTYWTEEFVSQQLRWRTLVRWWFWDMLCVYRSNIFEHDTWNVLQGERRLLHCHLYNHVIQQLQSGRDMLCSLVVTSQHLSPCRASELTHLPPGGGGCHSCVGTNGHVRLTGISLSAFYEQEGCSKLGTSEQEGSLKWWSDEPMGPGVWSTATLEQEGVNNLKHVALQCANRRGYVFHESMNGRG